MKKLLFLSFLLPLFASSQADTSMVEQYCSVNVYPRALSNKVTIEVDYGEAKSVWKNNRLKDQEGNVVKFNTYIDAMNYMGKQGWKLVNSMMITTGTANTGYYSYVFRKEFAKKETE